MQLIMRTVFIGLLLLLLPVDSARPPADTFVFPGRADTGVTFTHHKSHVEGGYLVEYNDNADQFSAFSSVLDAAGVSAEHRFDFNHKFFHGSSFMVNGKESQNSTMEKIMSTQRVKNVWPLRLIKRDAGIVESKLPNGAKHNLTRLEKRKSPDRWSTHAMTGVDKLHDQGLSGKGVLVAILDTGVDYNHPDLGGGFGPGFKVTKGYDFVGDNSKFGTDPRPDDDPYETCGLHGTWAAGIVAANTGALGASGVAPEANIAMYRIFDCLLWTSEDIVISAYLKAYDDGADVISLSFGSYSGSHSDPLGRVVSNIVDSGVICVAVNGEVGGPPFQANSPATAQGVLGVGTVENIVKPVFRFLGNYSANNKDEIFEYEPTDTPLTGRRPLWTWNYTMDYDDPYSLVTCPDFPDDTPQLTDSVVLVPFCLGTMLDALGLGVKHLMLHDNGEILQAASLNEPSKETGDLSGFGIITRQQGDSWKAAFLDGAKPMLTFTDPEHPNFRYREVTSNLGGLMATESSWGPSLEMDLVPLFSAPGANVLATLPKKHGLYGVLSRAGGAAPFVAGIAALMKQNNRRITPNSLAKALSTTARPINFNSQSANTYAPPIQQGSGLIDAYSALHSTTTVSPSYIKLPAEKVSVTIRNNGKRPQTYSVSHDPSISVYTVFSDLLNRGALPETSPDGVKMAGTPKVTVPPGTSISLGLRFDTPQSLNEERVPVYSGHISIKSSSGEKWSVPYLGSPTHFETINPMNRPSTFLATTDDISKRVDSGHVFKFPRNNVTDIEDFVLPVMMVGLDFHVREIQAELIPNGIIEGFDGRLGDGEPLGPLPPGIWFPIPVFGNLASGGFSPEGNFTLSVKALMNGKENRGGKWQEITSPAFGIQVVGGKGPSN